MSQLHLSPTLLVRLPHGDTRVCEVSRTPFTIGRTQDNDLCLDDITVSARHARIVTIQGGLFLEDLGSATGIFVNEQKIDRRQLRDMDNIRLGAHRLIFRNEQSANAKSAHASQAMIGDPTVVGSRRSDGAAPAPAHTIGIMEILSGQTGQAQYRLTRPVSLVGAQDDAVITLTGWFAPKTAAMISRRGDGYVVSQTESGKRILINSRPAEREQTLRHGDVLEVAGITMRFLLRDENSSAA